MRLDTINHSHYMKENNVHRLVMIISLSVFFLGGCGKAPKLSTQTKQLSANDLAVSNNLVEIWHLLQDATGESDHFPKRFSDLNLSAETAKLFVCPGTANRPGSLTNIEDWTDYIYVGDAWQAVPFAALVISPPENHQGKFGFVLCQGLIVLQLPPNQIRMLIKEPWLLATNTPSDNIDYLKQRMVVRVPKRLKAFYSDAYGSEIGVAQ